MSRACKRHGCALPCCNSMHTSTYIRCSDRTVAVTSCLVLKVLAQHPNVFVTNQHTMAVLDTGLCLQRGMTAAAESIAAADRHSLKTVASGACLSACCFAEPCGVQCTAISLYSKVQSFRTAPIILAAGKHLVCFPCPVPQATKGGPGVKCFV